MVPKKSSRVLIFLTLILFIVPIFYISKNLKNVELVIGKTGIFGPLVTIFLYSILSITPITTDPLTIISGVMFGPLMGVLISWTGNISASLIEYYFGAHLGKIADFDKARKKLPLGLGYLPVESPWFLIFGRLIPGYGSKLISILAGIHRVPLWLYLWTSALTNIIGSILLSFGGYQIIHLLKFWK